MFARPPHRVSTFTFRISCLFRISSFGFRISPDTSGRIMQNEPNLRRGGPAKDQKMQNEPNLTPSRASIWRNEPNLPRPHRPTDPKTQNEPNRPRPTANRQQPKAVFTKRTQFHLAGERKYAKRTQFQPGEFMKRTQFTPAPPSPRPRKCETNPIPQGQQPIAKSQKLLLTKRTQS